MIVLAVDPGTTFTATVLVNLNSEKILGRWYLPNPAALKVIKAVAGGHLVPNCLEVVSPNPKKKLVLDAEVRETLGINAEVRYAKPDYLVMEMVGNYSQTVGREVFETCMWSGIFIQAFQSNRGGKLGARLYTLIKRTQARMNLTGTSRSGDAQVNRALLDRVGEKGTKKEPGPMYGMKTDLYAALGVGLTFKDLEREYQAQMKGPRAQDILDGKYKIQPFWVHLESDGGDQTLTWPTET